MSCQLQDVIAKGVVWSINVDHGRRNRVLVVVHEEWHPRDEVGGYSNGFWFSDSSGPSV